LAGYLVLKTGEIYQGDWHGQSSGASFNRAGEVVFNTSHSGYEEIATDPSYFSQIVIMTAPMQGNYAVSVNHRESRKIWLEGFITTEVQDSPRDAAWKAELHSAGVPILSGLDTRKIVLRIRELGTPMGALVEAATPELAVQIAMPLIAEKEKQDPDWVHLVSRTKKEVVRGDKASGPRIAVLDYGCKENILRELKKVSREIGIFPSRTLAAELKDWSPDGILLSNGPGDPKDVQVAVETVRDLLGWRPVFGICMGHQILAMALGAKTFRLKFGHRGANHPVRDKLLNRIYVTSQNHGYAVDPTTLPSDVRVTHTNLNDESVEGIESLKLKCLSVQFHPESHPGPNEARDLFNYFTTRMLV
jgi:carbamoyl-phosphate synthase small subunit